VKLKRRFLYLRDFAIAGYEDQSWYGGLSFRMLDDEPVQAAFDRFAKRILDGIDRRQFVPVYRMADGELQFLTGKLPDVPDGTPPARKAVHALLQPARRVSRTARFHTCWGEKYYFWQRNAAVERLRDSIRVIAKHGYLALYFAERADGWSVEYFEPACDWLDANGIEIHRDNYVPFYSVYGLLSGRTRHEIFRGRNVLVVTHLTEARRGAIEQGLRELGVRSVSFIGIPATGSLFETVDVSKAGQVDLALVAAGIGSAPILTQLAPLSVPALDVGIWIDCLVDPSRRRERPLLRYS
jgi:hypothetical protein